MKCGDTSRQNNTYIVSGTVATSSSCSYHICPANENICRIKFLFTALTLASPPAGTSAAATTITIGRSLGACSDSLKITGGSANASPTICGTNTGQHMIMDSDGATCHNVNINVDATTTTRSWDIHVTHYDCKDMTALENTAGPKGCLQYHLGSSTGTGRIDNFNYVGNLATTATTSPTSPQHLINQDYTICMRRHAQMTRICYTVAAPAANNFGLSLSPAAASQSATDTSCTTDYLTIPGARVGGAPASIAIAAKKAATAAERLCGRFFNVTAAATSSAVICSYFTPFKVGVKFNDNETPTGASATIANTDEAAAPSGFIGFHLTYAQDAPTQP